MQRHRPEARHFKLSTQLSVTQILESVFAVLLNRGVIFLIVNRELETTDSLFWFMMQIAMLAGFLTSYPVNWSPINKGIKESIARFYNLR